MGLFEKKKNLPEAIPEPEQAAISDELLAVITAAIAAYESEQYTPTLNIRKINRAVGVKPAWGLAGLQESIDTRRM